MAQEAGMIGIYCITENATGKVYVGQSIHIESRWSEHVKSRPTELFSYIVEQECCIGLLDTLERYFIKKLNTLTPHGLNRSRGGWGKFGHNDAETCAKISASLIGNKHNLGKGKPCSEQRRQKMLGNKNGAALKGVPKSEATREAMRLAWIVRRKKVNT